MYMYDEAMRNAAPSASVGANDTNNPCRLAQRPSTPEDDTHGAQGCNSRAGHDVCEAVRAVDQPQDNVCVRGDGHGETQNERTTRYAWLKKRKKWPSLRRVP